MPKGIGYPNKTIRIRGNRSVRGRVQSTVVARRKAIKNVTANMLNRLRTRKR